MSRPHHSDPDIEAAWTETERDLAKLLSGYVTAPLVNDLAKRIINGLELRGWRPPLAKPHDVIAAARAKRQAEAP